jgi:hypothetical protein
VTVRDRIAQAMMAVPRAQPPVADLGRYGPRVLPQDYNTKLPLADEFQFRNWLAQNNVPFNPDAARSDYDMRGFYQAAQQGQPNVTTQINPVDNLLHYPDRFKTPLHESFSAQSQWAAPGAPNWINNETQLATPGGRIVFTEQPEETPP